MVTIDTIIDYLKDCVENKVPIGPEVWLDGAQKAVALLGDEHDKLYLLHEKIARIRVALMEEGATAAKAKIFAEASPEYRQMQCLKAKIGRIEEMIRIAKLQARLKTEEIRGYF